VKHEVKLYRFIEWYKEPALMKYDTVTTASHAH